MRGIIVAYDLEGGIGKNGHLLWGDRDQKDDMARFQHLTVGGLDGTFDETNSVIMGRTTFESIPEAYRPLRMRQNIVLSRQAINPDIDGVTWASSLGDAYSQADGHDTWVIGGASIYEQALPTVNRVLATRVLKHGDDADTFFPALSMDEWELFGHEEVHRKDARNRFGYIFSTYIRRSPIEE